MLNAFVSPQALAGHSFLLSERKLCVNFVLPELFLVAEAVLQNTLLKKKKVPQNAELCWGFMCMLLFVCLFFSLPPPPFFFQPIDITWPLSLPH